MFSTRVRFLAKKAAEVVTETPAKRVQSMCTVTPAFSKVLGRTEITRPDAVKQFWAYIKAHNLQVIRKIVIFSSIYLTSLESQ